MRYVSMFSGIEAASAAWSDFGWEALCFAEIEPFPSAILKHRYPAVPNVGDITRHDWSQYRGDCDLVVGGPPCQAFSVAGLRKSLSDDRGNLSLTYMEAIHAIDPLWSVTENVPGWLSTSDNAFGCFLAGLVGADAPLEPAGGRWTDSGVVDGPERTAAWRILDAQYFGLAQRRRRVIVLSCRGSGNWRCAAALFPVGESLSWNTPACVAQRKDAAKRASGSARGGSLWRQIARAFGADRAVGKQWPQETAPALDTTLQKYMGYDNQHINGGAGWFVPAVTHSLRGEGFDASEDGTGRGIPIDMRQASRGGKFTNNRPIGSSGGAPGTGIGNPGDPCPTLANSHVPAVAFSCKDHDAAEEVSPTLRAMGHDGSHANAGGHAAVAFDLRGREGGAMPEGPHDTANIRAASGGSSRSYVAETMAIRRLLPVECERLQGFEDGWTQIPWRGKPAELCPDGSRYKAIGNSMPVNVMHWLGQRIELIDSIGIDMIEAAE